MAESSLDELRQPWESDEHWLLRKEFIECYKNDFSEDRLMCLAQVYTNVELLSCTYPDEVMRQVRELSKGLTESSNLQQMRRERVQVQFVKANQNNPAPKHKKSLNSDTIMEVPECSRLKKSSKDKNKFSQMNGSDIKMTAYKDQANMKTLEGASSINSFTNEPSTVSITDNLKNLAMEVYAVMLKKGMPVEALHNVAQKKGIPFSFKLTSDPRSSPQNPIFRCKLIVCGVIVAKISDRSKKIARCKAVKYAMESLMQSSCRVVKNQSNTFSLTLKKEQAEKTNEINCSKSTTISEAAPKEDACSAETDFDDLSPISCFIKQNFLILDYSAIHRREGSISILNESAAFCHVPVDYKFTVSDSSADQPSQYRCEVFLNMHLISSGIGLTKLESKQRAAQVALEKLQKIAYFIKVKPGKGDEKVISRKQLIDITGPENSLSENNIGCKMMKMMGWSGGGIGKEKAGIVEPINTDNNHISGRGLGYSSGAGGQPGFLSRVVSLLQDYAKSNTTSDLVFTSEFSKEERKDIHKIALKYNLKNASRGQGDDRHIIISRKYKPEDLVKHLIHSGGSTSKYELVYPPIA